MSRDMPAGLENYELTNEYYTISHLDIPGEIQLGRYDSMRVIIYGVYPTYLRTTQIEFYYTEGSYTSYTFLS